MVNNEVSKKLKICQRAFKVGNKMRRCQPLKELKLNAKVENSLGEWVFKTKIKDDGTVDRYKKRLVARGFS